VTGAGHGLSLQTPGTASFTTASGIDGLTFGGGTLDSTGTVTANTYAIQGGTVAAALGTGTLDVQGNTTLTGTSAAAAVNVTAGTLTLGSGANRLTSATTVAVNNGATLDTGSASQQIGATGNLAALTNNGTLVVPAGISVGSINSPGVLQTGAGATLAATGDITATNAGNTFGDATGFTLGGTLNAGGDFAGAVLVDGTSKNVTINDSSASTLTVARMQVDPTAAVDVETINDLVIDAAQLSPVKLLVAKAPQGSVLFQNSSTVRNGAPGVLATQAIDVTISTSGQLNTQADPLYINPLTPSLLVTGDRFVPQNVWIAGNTSAYSPQATTNFLSTSAVSAIHAETARFLRMMQRADAGLLGVENLVLFGNLSLDAVVAPLSFQSLLIRQPRCLEEQRKGEASCQ
jgi:hypothetical protein